MDSTKYLPQLKDHNPQIKSALEALLNFGEKQGTDTRQYQREHAESIMKCDEEDEEFKSLMGKDEDSSCCQVGDVKRISSSSRVNFTKLTKKEQAARFKNMQKKI